MNLQIKLTHENATMPTRAYGVAAGLDFYALQQVTIASNKWAEVRTGIAVALPEGTAGFLYSRSGHGAKSGLSLINSVGVIDGDYRGEILAHIHNEGRQPYTIRQGERFCQLIIQKVETPAIQLVEHLPPTQRGVQGHGSSGRM